MPTPTRHLVALAVLLAACGKGEEDGPSGPFDVESYCEASTTCTNEYWAEYASDTGQPFVLDVDTCIMQWEAQADLYAGPCEATFLALEDCIASAEHLVCVRGSYGSGDCTVEALDLADCAAEMWQ